MYKIGISSCGKLIGEADFSEYRSSGIEAVEISVGYDACDRIDFKKLRDLSNQYQVQLWSFHLPFSPFSILEISQKALAANTIAYFETIIKKAAGIGIDKFVIHPSGEPIPPEARKERMKTAQDSLFRLANIAKENRAVIAVEDLPRTCLGNCSDEMAELTSVHPSLGVCFDTNHLLGESQVDFIQKFGSKIITTHISDYDFINERHWLPGEGKSNWHAIYNAFREIEYKGVWLYEVGFGPTKTITRERMLTCDDFVNNAKEIFQHQAITVIPNQKHC